MALGGGVLVLLGLSPWLAAVVGMVPLPVLGGAGIVLFGSVAASGVRTLSKVNYANNHNIVVVAVALAFGLIPVVAPTFWTRTSRPGSRRSSTRASRRRRSWRCS